ncbi:unnamed protein product [Rotaria socialis]|uniref:Uncharacterized protein n=2 Tax=Rotaria socialis TaxID=392032 RepID=A0A821QZ73_9BILA|nr:unnamed protein product [Rotaria socialis]
MNQNPLKYFLQESSMTSGFSQLLDSSNERRLYSKTLFENIPLERNEYCISTTNQLNNNSTCNDIHRLQQQSIEDIFKTLIDVLDEFLFFFSSFIQCKEYHTEFPLKNITGAIAFIGQLRLTLLLQMNNRQGHTTNSFLLNFSDISPILHDLVSFIHNLNQEQQQQQNKTIMEHSQTVMLKQFSDRLEKIIKSYAYYASMSNNSYSLSTPLSNIYPCMNSSDAVNNSIYLNENFLTCNVSNMCIPWSIFEPMKSSIEEDNSLGVMHEIKDENIRQNFSNDIDESKWFNRKKRTLHRLSQEQYQPSSFLNAQVKLDNNQQRMKNSPNNQMTIEQQISASSPGVNLTATRKQDFNEKSDNISTKSRIFQNKNTPHRLDRSRTISRQQSIDNSQRSSPFLSDGSNIYNSTRLDSIHNQLVTSNTREYMTHRGISPHAEELALASLPDLHESQHTPSLPLSFESHGYRSPSRRMSRENIQNLPPLSNKSIHTRQSNNGLSMNDVIGNNSILNTIKRNDDQRSLRKYMSQTPISYRKHIDSIDSSISVTSAKNVKNSPIILHKNREQHLTSLLPMKSKQRSRSTNLKIKVISPISNQQFPINKTMLNTDVDNYSNYQTSPSIERSHEMIQGDNISLFDGVERQDNDGRENEMSNTSRSNTKCMSTISNDLTSVLKTKKQNSCNHLFPSMARKKPKFCSSQQSNPSSQPSNRGYFNRFLYCFRRTISRRANRSEHQKQ